MNLTINDLAWEKSNGLIPAVVQHAETGSVLMLGYMNEEALQQTIATKEVTFFSRTKNRLWTKGEVSGNKLQLVNIIADCDNDTLLVLAKPTGPVCHKETATCFADLNQTDLDFVQKLERVIASRDTSRTEDSYTSALFNAGTSRIAQKVGEEAVEVALASIDKDDATLCAEVADLFFHVLVLLRARNLKFSDVLSILKQRMS